MWSIRWFFAESDLESRRFSRRRLNAAGHRVAAGLDRLEGRQLLSGSVPLGAMDVPIGMGEGVPAIVASAARAAEASVSPAAEGAANLGVNFSKLTLPSTVTAGTKTSAAAVVVLTNTGSFLFAGPVTLAVTADANGTSTPVNAVSKALKLKPGRSVTVRVPLKMIPNVAPGDYTFTVRVSDGSGNSSSGSFAVPVHIGVASASLVATLGGVSPSTLAAGSKARGNTRLKITNSGTQGASGTGTLQLVLVSGGRSVVVKSESGPFRVRARSSATLGVRFGVPAGTAAGVYQLVANITFAGQVLTATSPTAVTVT